MRLIDATKDPTIDPASANGHLHWKLSEDTQLIPWDEDLAGYFWAAMQPGVLTPIKVSVGYPDAPGGYSEWVTMEASALTVADFQSNPTAAGQQAYFQVI